jgi:O-antigen ligase
MLASRISIITLYAGLVVYAVAGMIRKGQWLKWSAPIIGLLVVSFTLVKFFPKTLNRFRELNYMDYHFDSHARESHYNMQLTPDQWNGANIRLAIWKCGWELAGRHWLTGVPLGDKEERLIAVYRERQFDFAVQSRRNMHNIYLDVLCNFGVIGLGVFLLGYFVWPLRNCLRYRDGWGAFIILAFAAALVTETWMDKSVGCILLAFFLSLISACQGVPEP